jgi:hypothetical protein
MRGRYLETLLKRSHYMELRKVSGEVTADDIKNGVPGDGKMCPVALSVLRALDAKNVAVGHNVLLAVGDGSHCNAYTTPQMSRFMYDFDRGRHEGHLWWRRPAAQPFKWEVTFHCTPAVVTKQEEAGDEQPGDTRVMTEDEHDAHYDNLDAPEQS